MIEGLKIKLPHNFDIFKKGDIVRVNSFDNYFNNASIVKFTNINNEDITYNYYTEYIIRKYPKIGNMLKSNV